MTWKKIKLYQNGEVVAFTKVDECDFPIISLFKWRLDSRGYAQSGKSRLLHRFLLKPPSNLEVDHINQDKLDNRRKNLRACTRSENERNKRTRRDCSTGYKGVSCFRKIFKAGIRIDGKLKVIGYFKTKVDAARAYNKAAKKHFGKYAWLNKV